MPILVGIDGTGEEIVPGDSRNASYDLAFAASFVHRICYQKRNAQYFRGPVALGGGMTDAINGAVAFIYRKSQQLPAEPILLTGYSRGAAAVVVVARRLKALGRTVRAMMLFDCVDRHVAFDAETISNNVQNVKHVIRNPAARSRITFSNDGMKFSSPTIYQPVRMYMCTHGGMGGTPWKAPPGTPPSTLIDEGTLEAVMSPSGLKALVSAAAFPMLSSSYVSTVSSYKTNVTYAQDAAVSQQIWHDVQPFLRTHHF